MTKGLAYIEASTSTPKDFKHFNIEVVLLEFNWFVNNGREWARKRTLQENELKIEVFFLLLSRRQRNFQIFKQPKESEAKKIERNEKTP